jgi:glycosyltransferase involved in cell wall biosynthesis
MLKMNLKILALIPAYNEEFAIQSVVRETMKYLPTLVADDGSTDATAKLARKVGAIIVQNGNNLGKGAALRNGFRYALENGYQAVLILDADGQHDPHEIPLFLESYQQNQGNLIIGMRDFTQMPFTRRLANTLGSKLVNRLTREHIPDNQSGYRLIDARLMELLLDSQEMGFEFEVEMIFACLYAGLSVHWVPIKTIYANEKSHISPLSHIHNYFRILRRVSKKYPIH